MDLPVTRSAPRDTRRHLKGVRRLKTLPKSILPPVIEQEQTIPPPKDTAKLSPKMHQSRAVLLAALSAFLLSVLLTSVRSQGLMGGFKGHHHRGSGAVELLLATGILAKLLNHRARNGPSPVGRHILHSLIGGARYPQRHGSQARFPMDLGHQSLLENDLIDPQASMLFPLSDELMLNQESALLGAKSPLLMAQNFPLMQDGQLLADAQISQQLLAARRARKLLEVRKLLAAQEAKNIMLAQSQAVQLLAAHQEAAQAASFLSPTRQLLQAASAPQHRLINKQQQAQENNHAQQQAEMMNNIMNAERRTARARSDAPRMVALPPGVNNHDTARLLAQLQLQHGL